MGYEKFISTDTKSITIDFGGILDVPSLSSNALNKMELKKRSYFSISDLIVKTIAEVFDNCEEKIILPYLSVLYKIKDIDTEYTEEELTDDIFNNINNDTVIKYIQKRVNDNYTENMDEKTETTRQTKKINTELQFTDQHNKILLAVAEAIRLSCPLVTEFIVTREKNIDETLYNVFSKIIERYQGNVNMLNKIHRFTYSRVVSTQYSDRTIWNLLRNKSKNVEIITQEFVQDIIIGILPKSVDTKNIINLFHVVIKRKIQFEFSKNHKVTYKPMNLNQTDSEGLTQFDKFDINTTKHNESIMIISKLSVHDLIPKVKKKYNVKFSKEEFLYYKKYIKIHEFQRDIIFKFFSNDIGSYNNFFSASRNDYIKLLIICYKYLKRRKLDMLAKYIIANSDRIQEKRISSRNSKIVDTIVSSKAYLDLKDHKYSSISKLLDENKVIIKTIGNLSVSKFTEFPDYQSYKKNNIDIKKLPHKEIEFDLTEMTKDYLTFLKDYV